MLLSFKPEIYKKIVSGDKIFEHRKVFPDEPIIAYLYVSHPISSITGILQLGKRHRLEDWKQEFSYDNEAIKRINDYMKKQKYAMEILQFTETNRISLETLRECVSGFVVPQMYYYLDNTELLEYLETNLKPTSLVIRHVFDSIESTQICRN